MEANLDQWLATANADTDLTDRPRVVSRTIAYVIVLAKWFPDKPFTPKQLLSTAYQEGSVAIGQKIAAKFRDLDWLAGNGNSTGHFMESHVIVKRLPLLGLLDCPPRGQLAEDSKLSLTPDARAIAAGFDS